MKRGVPGPGDKTREGEKPIFRQETHQGEEGLGQTTEQEVWGGKNRRGISTSKPGIWKTNGEGMVRIKSEPEAESAALQGRSKGKEGCTLL